MLLCRCLLIEQFLLTLMEPITNSQRNRSVSSYFKARLGINCIYLAGAVLPWQWLECCARFGSHLHRSIHHTRDNAAPNLQQQMRPIKNNEVKMILNLQLLGEMRSRTFCNCLVHLLML